MAIQDIPKDILSSNVDWAEAAPGLLRKAYRLAQKSENLKDILPVLDAISKLLPDKKVEDNAHDIRLIMSILTEDQLKQLEKMRKCK